MQNKIKEFILRNIKNELSITNKKVFNEITEDLEDIYINYIKMVEKCYMLMIYIKTRLLEL